MKIRFLASAQKEFLALPSAIQIRTEKQLSLLTQDLRHPSIRAKKYCEGRDIWQGRVNADYRFYFRIEGDAYVILGIMAHPK